MNLNQLSRKIEKARRDIPIYENKWGETTSKKVLKWVGQNSDNESNR